MRWLAVIAVSTAPALAQPFCAETDQIERALSEDFKESAVWEGFNPTHGVIMQLWTNSETSTWTIVATGPDGETCVVAAGTHGMERSPALSGEVH